MLGLTFSFKLDWDSYIMSIAKLPSRKLEPWFTLWSFFLLRLICIPINITQPCIEYCCHVWAGAPSCCLEFLNWCFNCWSFTCCLTWTLGSSSKFSLLKCFLRYYIVRCSFELDQLVSLSYSRESFTCYSDRLQDFFISFFPRTTSFWNSLPIEFFLLTYNLSGLNSRINRPFNCIFFLNRFCECFSLFVFL